MTAERSGSAQPLFDVGSLGSWSPTGTFEVQADQVAAYAAATNDVPWRTGGPVPPVFAILPAIDVYPRQIEELFGRSLASLGSVHGEHDLFVVTPLEVGTTVETRAAVVGVHVKPSGTAVVVKSESSDGGALANTQYAVQFLRGFDAGMSAGETQPSRRAPGTPRTEPPAAQVTYGVDLDQARRYAEASGDYGDYTLDDDAALAAGFARPILHGACTMAFAARAVIAGLGGGDPLRLRRLAVRFSAPCFPGDQLTITMWQQPASGANTAFAIADQLGRTIISNGLAEVGA